LIEPVRIPRSLLIPLWRKSIDYSEWDRMDE
jgi:hypothetical protein